MSTLHSAIYLTYGYTNGMDTQNTNPQNNQTPPTEPSPVVVSPPEQPVAGPQPQVSVQSDKPKLNMKKI